jgi:hypothetical protein
MSNNQKLFTVSLKKDTLKTVKQAIEFGASLEREVESIKGPFWDEFETEAMFIINLKPENKETT